MQKQAAHYSREAVRCLSSLMGAGNHENQAAVDGCGAGVSPAVAGASRSRARARCPRDRGRDARATIFKAKCKNEPEMNSELCVKSRIGVPK